MRYVAALLSLVIVTSAIAVPTRRQCRLACAAQRRACTSLRCRRAVMRACRHGGLEFCGFGSPPTTLPPDVTTTTRQNGPTSTSTTVSSSTSTTSTTLLCDYTANQVPNGCTDGPADICWWDPNAPTAGVTRCRSSTPEHWIGSGYGAYQLNGTVASSVAIRREPDRVVFSFRSDPVDDEEGVGMTICLPDIWIEQDGAVVSRWTGVPPRHPANYCGPYPGNHVASLPVRSDRARPLVLVHRYPRLQRVDRFPLDFAPFPTTSTSTGATSSSTTTTALVH